MDQPGGLLEVVAHLARARAPARRRSRRSPGRRARSNPSVGSKGSSKGHAARTLADLPIPQSAPRSILTAFLTASSTLGRPWPSLDSLPGDQRAVLQMVLQRGRSYDEIARLLSHRSGRGARARADRARHLGPHTEVAPEHQAPDRRLSARPAARRRGRRSARSASPTRPATAPGRASCPPSWPRWPATSRCRRSRCNVRLRGSPRRPRTRRRNRWLLAALPPGSSHRRPRARRAHGLGPGARQPDPEPKAGAGGARARRRR